MCGSRVFSNPVTISIRIVIIYTGKCPQLTAPDNGMIQCLQRARTSEHEPTPSTTRNSSDGGPISFPDQTPLSNPIQGDVCTFKCDEGYQLTGNDNRTCENDGTWSGSDVECKVPPSRVNVIIVSDNILHGNSNRNS